MPSVRLNYQTIEFDHVDIHVRSLRDLQQFSDDAEQTAEAFGMPLSSWPLFGVLWDSGRVLAQLMSDFECGDKRILEVGCGIGLPSLMLNSRNADITATDFHPEAGRFLAENVRLNSGRAIPFVRAAWADSSSGLERFDLIIGSDLLYQQDDLDMLSQFIEQHAQPRCEVIVVDQGRGLQVQFTQRMEILGYQLTRSVPAISSASPPDFKGEILRYRR
ncbi:MAG: methyltransferase domain-containing protein [Pseudomonadota bacterium]|nr:methyltransferase domain-containing protein [Pseudomonadota bacterium]